MIVLAAVFGLIWCAATVAKRNLEARVMPPESITALDVSKRNISADLPFLETDPALKIPDLERVTAAAEADMPKAFSPQVAALMPPQARIVIIIDDMGDDRVHTREAAALPGPLTLSYLPYPSRIGEEVAEGRSAGHEIMMHMPMEPLKSDLAKQDYFLRTGMTAEAFGQVLDRNLAAFSGYVGINNHMGSRLTQDHEAMQRVMEVLKARGLLFVDSRTISTTVAAEEAGKEGVPYAERNVFLDDDVSPEAVRKQLARVEQVARERGLAIAIGHPKAATIEALREWLPTLKDKGFILVPISAAVAHQPA